MIDKFPLVQIEAVEQYEKAADGDVKLYPSLELVRLEKWFFKSKKGKLLEYAFGSGCNTIHLSKCGYNIYGLDVSKNWVKKTNLRMTASSKLYQVIITLISKLIKINLQDWT